MSVFKNKSLDERKLYVKNMRTKFPGKIPLILERPNNDMLIDDYNFLKKRTDNMKSLKEHFSSLLE